jgi:hypothetical protein
MSHIGRRLGILPTRTSRSGLPIDTVTAHKNPLRFKDFLLLFGCELQGLPLIQLLSSPYAVPKHTHEISLPSW